MFKKQLNVNIKDLDVRIGKLNEELEELERDNKYEATMDKLKSLIELRASLTKSFKENELGNVDDSVLEMDKQIEELTKKIGYLGSNTKYTEKLTELEELTKVRCQLAESRVNGSLKPAIVTGLFGIASIAMVLKYEESEVITSKAFNVATSMFRGSK